LLLEGRHHYRWRWQTSFRRGCDARRKSRRRSSAGRRHPSTPVAPGNRRHPLSGSAQLRSYPRRRTSRWPDGRRVLVRRLRRWSWSGSSLPGDGINGSWRIREARRREPAFVQVRHEEMPPSWPARTPNLPATRGLPGQFRPGASTCSPAYDASMDTSRGAIAGRRDHGDGRGLQQEVDLQRSSRTSPTTSHHRMNVTASGTRSIGFRIALRSACVTCVIVPKDLRKTVAPR